MKIKKIWLIVFGMVLFWGVVPFSFSQEKKQEIIISWSAENFVPLNFLGKIIPSTGSKINIAVILIQNNKLIDLSKEKIYWYVNNELVSNEVGKTQMSFIAPIGRVLEVKTEIPNLGLIKTIEIPITKPRVVINAPFPKNEILNDYVEIPALVYFFNPKNNDLDYLSVVWQINGRSAVPSFNDQFLLKTKINSENNMPIIIEVGVQNNENQFEHALSKKELMFKKQ